MTKLVIDGCGPLTSIQDGGRPGFQHIGLPSSGALDPLALACANAIVGNALKTAAIELLLGGITLTCAGGAARLALAGSDFAIRLDGQPIAAHRSFLMQDSQRLSVRPAHTGVASVLAVEGGLDVPEILGSRALNVRGRIGGIDGRLCQPGDHLQTRVSASLREERYAPAIETGLRNPLRVVLGPQDDFFSPASMRTFLSSAFKVLPDSDRMAYKLSGPRIKATRGNSFISDGVPEGAIQVSGAGQLIVPLVDRQTIGGYPKIATIIAPDRRILAQSQPGTIVCFRAVSMEEAQLEYRRYHERMQSIKTFTLHSVDIASRAHPLNPDGLADNCVNALDEATFDFG